MEKTIKITNSSGLHARPASLFVKEASKYESAINLILGDKVANAKSIMNLLSMGIKFNDEITIKAEGKDAKEAVDALIALVESNFNGI